MRGRTAGKRLLLAVAAGAACLLAAAAVAAAGEFASRNEFSRWEMNYFRNPEPARIPAALDWYARNIPRDKFNDYSGMAFFATALATDPSLARQVFATADGGGSDRLQVLAAMALWQSQTLVGEELLSLAAARWKGEAMARYLDGLRTHRPKNLFTAPITHPAELDALWSMFFATGEAPAVARIREVAKRKAAAKTPQELALCGAAAWSLESNAKNYPEVRRIVEFLDSNEAATQAKGSAINFGEVGTWKRQSGSLAATLLVVPDWDAFLQEWQKSTPGVEITTTTKTPKGKKIAAVVLFSGCAPDAQGLCRSTVRFKAFRPDGKLDGEQSGELWTGKPVPAAGIIQLSVTNLIMSYADSDPAGTYRIVATIHDELAARDLELETALTVE